MGSTDSRFGVKPKDAWVSTSPPLGLVDLNPLRPTPYRTCSIKWLACSPSWNQAAMELTKAQLVFDPDTLFVSPSKAGVCRGCTVFVPASRSCESTVYPKMDLLVHCIDCCSLGAKNFSSTNLTSNHKCERPDWKSLPEPMKQEDPHRHRSWNPTKGGRVEKVHNTSLHWHSSSPFFPRRLKRVKNHHI